MVFQFLKLDVDGFVIFIWGNIITSITSVFDGLLCFFAKKEARMKKFYGSLFLFYLSFLSEILTINGTAADRKGTIFGIWDD